MPSRAPSAAARPPAAMQWGEGDQWLLTLELPAGSHEFKVVTVAPPAKEGSCGFAEWEAGPNRTVQARVARGLCCAVLCCALRCARCSTLQRWASLQAHATPRRA